jgi:hypothetical protein
MAVAAGEVLPEGLVGAGLDTAERMGKAQGHEKP